MRRQVLIVAPRDGVATAVTAEVGHNVDPSRPVVSIVPLPLAIAALEARAIREALAATGGNKVAAAKLLGISRAKLYERLESIV